MSKAYFSPYRFLVTALSMLLSMALLSLLLGSGRVIAQDQSAGESADSGADSTPSTNPGSFSLDYTGALFGYYRVEPDESEPQTGVLGPPREFLSRMHQPLLLGMGDNFGPEFGASEQREFRTSPLCYLKSNEPSPEHKNVPPEVLYKNEDRLPRMAECDNVGRFLMLAGYRAIVPGREDFLYSARWLRRMALLFRGASDPAIRGHDFPDDGTENTFISANMMYHHPNFKRLFMLAANLRVNFKVESSDLGTGLDKQPLAAKVKHTCPLFFSWDLLAASPETCIPGGDNGDTVTTEMDWLTRLDSTLEVAPDCSRKNQTYDECLPVAQAMNRQAQDDKVFRTQLLQNQTKIALSGLGLDPRFLERSCGTNEAIKAASELLKQAQEDVKSLAGKLENEKSDFSGADAKKFSDSEASKAMDHILQNMESTKKQSCVGLAEDVKTIVDDLHHRIALLSKTVSLPSTPTEEQSYLFSPRARKAGIRLLLRKIAAEQEDVGYTIVAGSGPASGTLVVGVIGKETMKAISPVNLQLCTHEVKLKAPANTKDLGLCNSSPEDRPDEVFPKIPRGRLVGTIQVGNPALAVTTLVRAAWVMKSVELFDKVVIMAQMPRTEAEELAVRVQSGLKRTSSCAELQNGQDGCARSFDLEPHVDLIISEAQKGHVSGDLELHYAREFVIPVVAPRPGWYSTDDEQGLIAPLCTVTLEPDHPGGTRIRTNALVTNKFDDRVPDPVSRAATQTTSPQTMAELLVKALFSYPKQSQGLSRLKAHWEQCGLQRACRESAIMQFLLKEIQRSAHVDVAMLEYRDFYFGYMLPEYGGYDVCSTWWHDNRNAPDLPDHAEQYCELRVALDRVLWKGDYSERVMVDGKDLKGMLTTAQQVSDEEQTLLARDTTQEWLLTFGIVTELPKNLSAASRGPETFAIPGWAPCKSDTADAGEPTYCVNGQKITDDGAYWVSTSDHLAEDTQVYKVLAALDPTYRQAMTRLFLTGEIEEEIEKQGERRTPEPEMKKAEEYQQIRPILQLDYAKVVAGFMVRAPNVTDAQLATDFAGVAESRATTPHAGEIDLEAVGRTTRGLGSGDFSRRMKVGVQSDLEYDRAFTGNLTGSPDTVAYALNSFTVGGFLQFRPFGEKPLPRLLLVAAPYQYQQQIAGNPLTFKFTTGSGQVTVPTRRWEGFSQRLGARYEFGGGPWPIPDPGSYVEAGPEFSDINHVLSGVLVNGTECPVLATFFKQCLAANNLSITASTVLTPLTETLHTGGWYWDVHLQKALDKAKRSSLTVETKGDNFMFPGVTLPTQSRYAFTTTGAVNFAVIGNLVFSPTFTTFFYKNQETPEGSHSLVTNTFSITAKWYFGRDAAVPFWRQLWFQGPASLDQTKSAKMMK